MLDAERAIETGAGSDADAPRIPDYLERVYWWAYLRPASIRIFDRTPVVSAILWGQYRRLSDAALFHIALGDRVLQLACVYGNLSERIVQKVGKAGTLDIVDIAPIQIENVRRKLAGYEHARATVADAATAQVDQFDCVLSFFLLHELPDLLKRRVVDAALAAITPGGKAVFVEYARPAHWHPVRPVISAVFALLEPFAASIWRTPIIDLASRPADFRWTQTRHFGGLFQVVLVKRV